VVNKTTNKPGVFEATIMRMESLKFATEAAVVIF
jgi:hypothetical protein